MCCVVCGVVCCDLLWFVVLFGFSVFWHGMVWFGVVCYVLCGLVCLCCGVRNRFVLYGAEKLLTIFEEFFGK